MIALISVFLCALVSSAFGIAPSTKYDLRKWKITLPTGDEVSAATLSSGYDNPNYFTLSPSPEQYMRFIVPGDGGTTANSDYPRSELREMPTIGYTTADQPPSNWKIESTTTHRLKVTTKVVSCNPASTIIGQIHGKITTERPLVKLYWGRTSDNGKTYDLHARVKLSPSSDTETHYAWFFTVPTGTLITYQIEVYGTSLKLRAGLAGTTLTAPYKKTDTSFESTVASSISISNWASDYGYFKAGNYFQTKTKLSTDRCVVDISSISVTHGVVTAALEEGIALGHSGIVGGANPALVVAAAVCAVAFVALLVILIVVVKKNSVATEIV